MATPCSITTDEHRSLADLTSRLGYFERASEVIQCIPAATDEVDAVALLKEASERMGAGAAAFASFVRDDSSHESYRFLLACDPMWCFEYERRAWYANDPWLGYALNHSEPTRASEIAIGSEQQRAVVNLAEDFGFRSAVIIPAPSGGGLSRVGVLCLGSSEPEFFEGGGFIGLKLVARSLAMELHEWWIGKIKRELIVGARITAEDLILLKRERLGQSTKMIAAALNTSPSSVDSRFQRINAKLGVPNRKAAANLAAEYGLI
jgi:DNA-binding CsgD family transcriptional regulator